MGDQHYAEAEHILRPALALEGQSPHCLVFTNAHLMLAYLYLLWHRAQQALSELAPLLADCERRALPGLVLREGAAIVTPLLRLAVEREVHAPYAAHLLSILGASQEPRRAYVPETGQTLTIREVEVLRLITTGASNRAIAHRMVISERTVKTHVTNILSKLNVQSRTQAAARARDLRIV
ncbi:MAG: response regulator transcription factor [Chloroflexi bacterium]|nr:response regulator transcription factor [Chloroflexota bacterium]